MGWEGGRLGGCEEGGSSWRDGVTGKGRSGRKRVSGLGSVVEELEKDLARMIRGPG